MQFRLVVTGAIILLVGLVAYVSIPSVHRTPTISSQAIFGPTTIPVPAQGSVEIPKNITIIALNQTELRVNITITAQNGDLSSLRFQLFSRNETMACSNTHAESFLLDQEVSNQSLKASLKTSGNYCFVFNNEDSKIEDSRIAKIVLISASLVTALQQTRFARDGMINVAGIGLGLFGFVIVLYGASRKTLIPWE